MFCRLMCILIVAMQNLNMLENIVFGFQLLTWFYTCVPHLEADFTLGIL